MRIGLDCDGILYDWEEQCRRMLLQEFRIKLPLSYRWDSIQESITPEQWKWVWTDAISLGLFDLGRAYTGAIGAVSALRNIGDVVIITSIPKDAIPYRLEWLRDNHIYFDEFRVVNGLKEKSKVVPLCDVYIDDSSEVAEDILTNTSAEMILWNRPWNFGANSPRLSRIYWRVDHWDGVMQVVKGLK